METRSEDNGQSAMPTPEEAAAALRSAEESERAAMITDGGPRWYWPALGALVALQAFIPMIQTEDVLGWVLWAGANLLWLVALAVLVTLLVLRVGVVYRIDGKQFVRAHWPLVVGGVVFVIATGVAAVLDLVGLRIAISLAAAVLVMAYGLVLQTRLRRAAESEQARES